MIIPVLQLPRAKQKLYLFPPLCFQCVWNLTSITDFMNDWNITTKKTRPLKARLPEGGQTKALFNPSCLWQQAPGPVKPLGTGQSTPQNTAMAPRKFGHMKLCVKYRGPGIFIFSTSRRLFSKECSQTICCGTELHNSSENYCLNSKEVYYCHQVQKCHWLKKILLYWTREKTIHRYFWGAPQANREEAAVLFSLWRIPGAHSPALTTPCTFKTRHRGYCILNYSYLHSKNLFLSLLLSISKRVSLIFTTWTQWDT